jgi:hypothetical protein
VQKSQFSFELHEATAHKLMLASLTSELIILNNCPIVVHQISTNLIPDHNLYFVLVQTVASKYCDDFTCAQLHYARCGGVSVKELNALELELFRLLGYRAHVSTDEYRESQLLMRSVMNSMLSVSSVSTK